MGEVLYDKNLAKIKSFYFKKTREFFDENKFLEVETPSMTPIVDPEPSMKYFETIFDNKYGGLKSNINGSKKIYMYLITSPEFQMKKLLGSGFGNIYTLSRVFRNSEVGGGRHNPEFTMLEWYRVNAGYKEMMEDTEKFIKFISKQITTTAVISDEWEKKTLNELFIEYCKIDLNKNRELEQFKKTVGEKYDIEGCNTWDDVMYKIFLNHIEPKLGFEKPVFVYDYPATQAALARKKDDKFWAERFELYINGNEICNGFSELTDSSEQRQRFEEQNLIRKNEGKAVFPIDEEFLEALDSMELMYDKGCGGNALGMDRLLKVLLEKEKIEDVMLFPFEKMFNRL